MHAIVHAHDLTMASINWLNFCEMWRNANSNHTQTFSLRFSFRAAGRAWDERQIWVRTTIVLVSNLIIHKINFDTVLTRKATTFTSTRTCVCMMVFCDHSCDTTVNKLAQHSTTTRWWRYKNQRWIPTYLCCPLSDVSVVAVVAATANLRWNSTTLPSAVTSLSSLWSHRSCNDVSDDSDRWRSLHTHLAIL